jgi:hypothetical protein
LQHVPSTSTGELEKLFFAVCKQHRLCVGAIESGSTKWSSLVDY